MLSTDKLLLLDSTNVKEFDSYLEEKVFLEEESKVTKTAKSADRAGISLLKSIKSLYSTNDEHLVEGTMELSKIITRVVIVRALFLINPMVGVIAFFTGLAIRKNNDIKNRQKLMRMYKSKLEYIEDKIPRVTDDKEKEGLIRIKHRLKDDIHKLEISVIGDSK